MTDASEVLVIILSIFLAIFLLLAIILSVLLIKVASQIKRITAIAETTAQNVGQVVDTASKYAAPAMMSRFVAKTVAQALKKAKR